MADLYTALLKQLPSLAVMITGLMMVLFSSTGQFINGGKIDERTRRLLSRIGWPLFYVGLATTAIVLILSLLDNLQPYSPYLHAFWTKIVYFFSPTTLIIFVVLIICAIGIRYLNLLKIEKGYKLQAIPVLDGEIKFQDANIQVKNVGHGSINCIVRLVRVIHITTKKGGGEEETEIDINKINPNGYFLSWDDGKGNAILREGIPRVVKLISVHNREAKVLFYGGTSQRINPGKYLIEVDILRIRGKKHVKMETVNGLLGINLIFRSGSSISGEGIKLEWVKET